MAVVRVAVPTWQPAIQHGSLAHARRNPGSGPSCPAGIAGIKSHLTVTRQGAGRESDVVAQLRLTRDEDGSFRYLPRCA